MSDHLSAPLVGASRRAVLGGAAWSAPLVVVASAVPAFAASTPVLTPGTRYSLRSTTPGEETLYLSGRADQSAAAMLSLSAASSLQDRQLATFTVVAGLTGSAGSVAFQSVSNVTWYLRHANRIMYVQAGSGTVFQQDASYVVVPGLSGIGSSLRSTTTGYTNQYVRRNGTSLVLNLPTDTPTTTFNRDASFFLAAPLAPVV